MYVRKKKINGRDYYYLVRSVREDGKVRQKYVDYLGTKEPSKRKVTMLIRKHTKALEEKNASAGSKVKNLALEAVKEASKVENWLSKVINDEGD